mgnify:CR=1 FL=1
MKKLILKLCVLAGLLSGAAVDAADKAKVVFISCLLYTSDAADE